MTPSVALLVWLAAPARTPAEVAAEIRDRRNGAVEIEIGEGPRWTPTLAPVGGNGRDMTTLDGGLEVPQEGGGRFGDDADGWEGDPWFEPDPATPRSSGGGPSIEVEPTVSFELREGLEPPPLVPIPPNPPPSAPEPSHEPEPAPAPAPAVEVSPPRPPGLPQNDLPPAPVPSPAPDVAPTPEPDYTLLWWLLVGLACAAGLVKTCDVLRRSLRGRASPISIPPRSMRPQDRTDEITLSEMDYAAEIRALLRVGLEEAGWRAHGRDLSRTAREVCRDLGPEDPRAISLGRLVAIAERIHFAGVEATPAAYEDARAALLAMQSACPARLGGGR